MSAEEEEIEPNWRDYVDSAESDAKRDAKPAKATLIEDKGRSTGERRSATSVSASRSGIIPAEAFEYYVSLGAARSYRAVAERYGVNKRAVSKHAARKNWIGRLGKMESAEPKPLAEGFPWADIHVVLAALWECVTDRRGLPAGDTPGFFDASCAKCGVDFEPAAIAMRAANLISDPDRQYRCPQCHGGRVVLTFKGLTADERKLVTCKLGRHGGLEAHAALKVKRTGQPRTNEAARTSWIGSIQERANRVLRTVWRR